MVPSARVSRSAPRVAGTPVRREAAGSVHPAHLAVAVKERLVRRAAAVLARRGCVGRRWARCIRRIWRRWARCIRRIWRRRRRSDRRIWRRR